MSLKLKVLGLGLLAVMATSAFSVMNASAVVSGHFTSDTSHTLLVGEETKPAHQVKLQIGNNTKIECTVAKFTGTTGLTATEVTITPTYSECTTEGGPTPHNVLVTMNGCDYVFKSNSTTHGTVEVVCPPEKAIEIHHPNCTVTVPAQIPSATTLTGGVTYTTTTENGKHALTANVTVANIHAQYHGGICIFLGTPQTSTMTGSATLRGTNTAGEPVGITTT